MIAAVTFDLFDTIVDLHMEDLPEFEVGGRRLRGTQGALHAALSGRSGVDLETFIELLGQTDRELLAPLLKQGLEHSTIERFERLAERLGISDPTLPEELTQIHMQHIADRARYLPHHVALLRDLAEQLRVGVCSNFSHSPTALQVLEESGLAPHVHAVTISEQVGIRKPRPEIFSAMLEQLGVAAEETLHVGDRLDADVSGAAAMGMIPVWITRRVGDPKKVLEKHEGPPPAHVIEDLEELRAIVG